MTVTDLVGSTDLANYQSILPGGSSTSLLLFANRQKKKIRKRQPERKGKKRRKTNWNDKISIKGADMVAVFLFAYIAMVTMNERWRLLEGDINTTKQGHCQLPAYSIHDLSTSPIQQLFRITLPSSIQGCVSTPYRLFLGQIKLLCTPDNRTLQNMSTDRNLKYAMTFVTGFLFWKIEVNNSMEMQCYWPLLLMKNYLRSGPCRPNL